MDGKRKPNFWRGLSVIRKAQVIGTLSGLLVTVGILAGYNNPEGYPLFSNATMFTGLNQIPTHLIAYIAGLDVKFYIEHGTWSERVVSTMYLMVFINTLLSFLAGTAIGWCVDKRK
jgi:hypothetical protein